MKKLEKTEEDNRSRHQKTILRRSQVPLADTRFSMLEAKSPRSRSTTPGCKVMTLILGGAPLSKAGGGKDDKRARVQEEALGARNEVDGNGKKKFRRHIRGGGGVCKVLHFEGKDSGKAERKQNAKGVCSKTSKRKTIRIGLSRTYLRSS